jgi:exonuclease SbcC
LEEVANDGTVYELKVKINQLKAEKLQAENGVKAAQEKHSASVAESAKQRAMEESLTAQEKELSLALEKALLEEGFESKDEAVKLLITVGDPVLAKGEFESFFTRLEAVKSRLKDISKESFEGFVEELLVAAVQAAKTLDDERLNLVAALSVEEEKLARLNALREKYLELKKEKEGLEKQRKLWEQLRSLTAKNKFMEFIASEYLQDVCLDASDRLLKMTGNRYFLRYETEFMVGDNFDGGNLRAVRTLSGGETFLVSLSLALSLSNAIFSRSLRPIEFFFLDEGFGTLDGKLVDTVMDVLGKLSKNFAVGLISHVDELKTRIENKILVSAATETHGSTIKTETYA